MMSYLMMSGKIFELILYNTRLISNNKYESNADVYFLKFIFSIVSQLQDYTLC